MITDYARVIFTYYVFVLLLLVGHVEARVKQKKMHSSVVI